jgi:hypothetical protein
MGCDKRKAALPSTSINGDNFGDSHSSHVCAPLFHLLHSSSLRLSSVPWWNISLDITRDRESLYIPTSRDDRVLSGTPLRFSLCVREVLNKPHYLSAYSWAACRFIDAVWISICHTFDEETLQSTTRRLRTGVWKYEEWYQHRLNTFQTYSSAKYTESVVIKIRNSYMDLNIERTGIMENAEMCFLGGITKWGR